MSVEAAIADAVVARILPELERIVRDQLAPVLAALPSQFVSLAEAAKALGVDARTVTAMCSRGELTFRMAGRRRLVDASSMRPPTREQVAAEARAVRS
jgi:excisionase family DNA binding protein